MTAPAQIPQPAEPTHGRAVSASHQARRLLHTVRTRIRPVTNIVSPLGWALLAAGPIAWIVGSSFGWAELLVIACAAWLLVGLCVLTTLGRARLTVDLVADPQRVTVGAPAAGAVRVRNIGRRPLMPIGLDLPIGKATARFSLPVLRPGDTHEELFVVPTERRGVVEVGPAVTVRGDPLGVLRRSVTWTDSMEIFVHPITVRLDSLGAGFLRDLEGQTTNQLSSSDLAFHALRDYQPGDDRRHIHWRSSAKAGRYVVRQFLDTRKSHVCVVVDSAVSSYPDPDDYELAISAAASLTIRTVLDDQEVTVLVGDHAIAGAATTRVRDIFSRAELGEHGVIDLTRRATRISPDVSLALLVVGSAVPLERVLQAAHEFPVEVRRIALRIDPTQPTSIRESRGISLLSLQRLGDLPNLLAGAINT